MAGAERTPALSMLLGFGPAALLPLFALAAWFAPMPWNLVAVAGGQFWAAAILIFLAGVRRGLSFFTEGGPRRAQIVTMLGLFLLGLGGLLLAAPVALLLLMLGYAGVAFLDPPAARRGEVPAFFARLRPPQMTLALAGLAGLLARLLFG